MMFIKKYKIAILFTLIPILLVGTYSIYKWYSKEQFKQTVETMSNDPQIQAKVYHELIEQFSDTNKRNVLIDSFQNKICTDIKNPVVICGWQSDQNLCHKEFVGLVSKCMSAIPPKKQLEARGQLMVAYNGFRECLTTSLVSHFTIKRGPEFLTCLSAQK